MHVNYHCCYCWWDDDVLFHIVVVLLQVIGVVCRWGYKTLKEYNFGCMHAHERSECKFLYVQVLYLKKNQRTCFASWFQGSITNREGSSNFIFKEQNIQFFFFIILVMEQRWSEKITDNIEESREFVKKLLDSITSMSYAYTHYLPHAPEQTRRHSTTN